MGFRQFGYSPTSLDGGGATARDHFSRPKRRYVMGWDGRIVDTSARVIVPGKTVEEFNQERRRRIRERAEYLANGGSPLDYLLPSVDVVPYNPINNAAEQRRLYLKRVRDDRDIPHLEIPVSRFSAIYSPRVLRGCGKWFNKVVIPLAS